jgi:4-carboxymuconolactone decarboxylase
MTPIKILILGLFISCLTKDVQAQDQTLDRKQQSIVVISAFTAKGDLLQLQKALNDGLDAGLTVNEIKEVLVQLYAYTGFPRSLNALNTLMTVLKERKGKSINDPLGKAPSPLPTDKSRLQFGTELQTKLIGRPVSGEVYQFAPAIDQFLKEHLFGAIFGRDNLDWKTREIATIAALASLGGAENQLRSHLAVGKHNGLTDAQLKTIVSITENIKDNTETIFPKGEQITNNNFTGNAWLQQLVLTDTSNNIQVGSVTFEPGARTNWHLHPAGQILLATDGLGYYQEKGSPKKLLRKGDVVKCPPNVPHWHGASRDQKFVQIAITNAQNGPTVWFQPVTDEEYN